MQSVGSLQKSNPGRAAIFYLSLYQVMTRDLARQQNRLGVANGFWVQAVSGFLDCLAVSLSVWAFAVMRKDLRGFTQTESRKHRGRALQPRCICALLMISHRRWYACLRTLLQLTPGLLTLRNQNFGQLCVQLSTEPTGALLHCAAAVAAGLEDLGED